MIHQFRETRRIEFPNDRGVTGISFQTGQIIHANRMHNQKDYMSDIDNLTPCRNVKNFLIGPVYAHKENANTNDKVDTMQFDRQKPIGMIQLVNKDNYELINPHDLRKF